MKAEEFSVWFSGVGRLSVEQRGEVAAALANLDGGLSGREKRRSARPAGRGTKARSGVVVRVLWGRAAKRQFLTA
jgi:hypothetical protein